MYLVNIWDSFIVHCFYVLRVGFDNRYWQLYNFRNHLGQLSRILVSFSNRINDLYANKMIFNITI